MKVCIQTGDVVDRLGLEKGYSAIKNAGFEAIDWNLDHAWKGSDIYKGEYLGKCIFEKELESVIEHYSDELEIIKKNNLIISQAHAPFPCYIKENPEFLDYAIEIYKRNIEYCDYIGCKKLVIHGISYDLNDSVNTPVTIEELNIKLYSSLIPTLLNTNVTVCLENIFTHHKGVNYQGVCADPKEASELVDKLNEMAGKEVFGFCLDIGHANLLHRDLKICISQLGKRLKALHIHDNDGKDDLHLAPLTGTVDWQRFCSALKEIGYDGDLDFETFSQINRALDCNEELLYVWLKLIYETGNCFRNMIKF